MSSFVLAKKLDWWIEHNQNVLFVGRQGVGKSTIVLDAFKRNKLNFLYFSAATIDPWVDFVGVPCEKQENKIPEEFYIIKELYKIDRNLAIEWVSNNWKMSEKNSLSIVEHALQADPGRSHLELIRPHRIDPNTVEAMFFDEANRSKPKVQNALMELTQFKTINGTPFPKLKIIWAAINPDDDNEIAYNVEKMDVAQTDRYHIHIEVPYEPNIEWFREKYGNRLADSAVQWWKELDQNWQNKISPRRLEYALNIYTLRGDMRDVLPMGCNVTRLIDALNNGPITEKLEMLMQSGNSEDARKFLKNENNYSSAMNYILKSNSFIKYFIPLLPKEKISKLMAENDAICRHIIDNSANVPVYMNICKEIVAANTNKNLSTQIKRFLTNNQDIANVFSDSESSAATQLYYNPNKSKEDYEKALRKIILLPIQNLEDKKKVYTEIEKNVPKIPSETQCLVTLTILEKIAANEFASSVRLFPNLWGIAKNCFQAIEAYLNIKEEALTPKEKWPNLQLWDELVRTTTNI